MKDETKCYALLSQEKSILNDSPVVYITNLTFKKIGFPSGCIDERWMHLANSLDHFLASTMEMSPFFTLWELKEV